MVTAVESPTCVSWCTFLLCTQFLSLFFTEISSMAPSVVSNQSGSWTSPFENLTHQQIHRGQGQKVKQYNILVKMLSTVLKQTCPLCRKRAGHKVLHEESKKAHSSPDFTRLQPRGT